MPEIPFIYKYKPKQLDDFQINNELKVLLKSLIVLVYIYK